MHHFSVCQLPINNKKETQEEKKKKKICDVAQTDCVFDLYVNKFLQNPEFLKSLNYVFHYEKLIIQKSSYFSLKNIV